MAAPQGGLALSSAEKQRAYRANNRAHVRARDARYRIKYRDTKQAYYLKRTEERPYELLIKAAKNRAAEKGLEFSLTYEWAQSVWTGYCALTGIQLVVKRGHGGAPNSPSLDRINNSLGYTQANSRFVCHAINSFKNTMTDDEMYSLAEALLKNRG